MIGPVSVEQFKNIWSYLRSMFHRRSPFPVVLQRNLVAAVLRDNPVTNCRLPKKNFFWSHKIIIKYNCSNLHRHRRRRWAAGGGVW